MRALAVLLVLCCHGLVFSAESGTGQEHRVSTRNEVTVPIYTYWRDDAVATVVLFSGGGGGYGKIGENGWPTSNNFLIRTGSYWATHPFNLVMVGRPSDGIDLSNGNIRTDEQHTTDNLAILKTIKQKSPLPIWLVGTSMGTISVTATAIQDKDKLISGLVLTSSISSYQSPGAVPKQDIQAIRIPTLIFHHENDTCKHCQPHEARNMAEKFKNVPIRKTLFVQGGSGTTGNPCGALHHHGYIGMEKEAVDLIATWIINPTE